MAPISDEDWEDLVTNELPQDDDPVIQKYLDSRKALKAEEHKQRSDYSFRQALSPIAKRACHVAAEICGEEQAAARGSGIVAQGNSSMLSHLQAGRQSTRSWRIAARMPKGALLGVPWETLVDLDHLLNVALDTPGMHISCPEGHLATAESRSKARVDIRFRAQSNTDETLWSDTYHGGTFLHLAKAAEDFPDGGKEGFIKWLKQRCAIPWPNRAHGNHVRAEIVGSMPYKCPDTIAGIVYYEPVWRACLQRFMAQLVADGIHWAELGLDFSFKFYRKDSESPEPDYDHMFRVIAEEVAKFQAGGDSGLWGIRLIWSTPREQDRRSTIESMDDCIATKMAWPDLLAGYGLASPLGGSLPELFWFRKQCALEEVQIPFFLRAGERLVEGGSADDGLFDALLLGARRIGGGSALVQHPRLIEAIKDKRILVESGPVSTKLSPLSGSDAEHSLLALLARGVPCALAIDGIGSDPEAFSPATDAFWTALHAWDWDSVGLAGLGSLAENSVRWAAFEDQDAQTWTNDIRTASMGSGRKAQRLKQWAIEWEQFCLWIVTEFGDAWDDGNGHGDGERVDVESTSVPRP